MRKQDVGESVYYGKKTIYVCAHVSVFLEGLYHKIVTQERELDVWQKSEEIFHCLPFFSSLEP